VKRLRIALPKPGLQHAIGNKLRAAERLRQQAEHLMRQAESRIRELLGDAAGERDQDVRQFAWHAFPDATARFDPAHYRPNLVANHVNMLRSGGTELGELTIPKSGITGGSTPLGAEYLPGGVRFVRTQDYGPLGVQVDQCVFISEGHDRANARSRLAVDDVLLSITGVYFGESAVVTEECLPANISQHSVRIRLKDREGANPYWISAYLNSPFGKMETLRHSTGFTRPALDYSAVRQIIIPLPDPTIQRSLGDQIRVSQAQRRRSQLLTRQAIKDVESMIEGAFDKAECLSQGRQLAVEFGLEAP
jgi:hypothetical protein